MESIPKQVTKPSWVSRWLGLLLRPSPKIVEVGERRQVELLAAVTLLLGVTTGIGLIASLAMGTPIGSFTLGGMTAVALTCYALSRTTYYRLGSILLLTGWTVMTFTYAASGRTTNGPLYSFLTFIPLAFVMGVVLLGYPALVGLVAVNLAGVLLYQFYDPTIRSNGYMTGAGILVFLGAATLVTQHYRNLVERERLQALAAANLELDILRKHLEGQVAELHKTQEILQAGQGMMRRFQERLKVLHEVTVELAQCDSLEALLRQAIVLGRARLGFDRLGLFLVDPESHTMMGTFGTDVNGELSDERNFMRPIEEDSGIMQVIQSQQRTKVWENVTLWEETQPVGTGWNAMAAIWDGNQAVGWLAADNLIRHEPLRPYIEELMLLYGAALGALIRRKQAEELLRGSEEKFSKAFMSSPDAMAIVRMANGLYLELNDSFCRDSGYTREEIVGHTVREVPIFASLDELRVFQKTLQAEGRVYDFETQWRTKTGNIGYGIISAEGITIGGEPCVLIQSKNISDRKLMEQELRQLNEALELRVAERTAQLQAANKEMEAFSYSVSHDLRAPLRAVNGFAKIIEEDFQELLPADGKHYLQRIMQGAAQMSQLIDDLLAFSRLGRKELFMEDVNLTELVREVMSELQSEMTGRTVQVQIQELPPCHADQALMKQVFSNLIGNALKYTQYRDDALVEIGAYLKNNHPVYYVKDNGAGFNMEYAGKLFGVFQRLHRQDEFEGTGVGLAIVQRIIHRHSGRIWAEAEEDRGATFYFTIGSSS